MVIEFHPGHIWIKSRARRYNRIKNILKPGSQQGETLEHVEINRRSLTLDLDLNELNVLSILWRKCKQERLCNVSCIFLLLFVLLSYRVKPQQIRFDTYTFLAILLSWYTSNLKVRSNAVLSWLGLSRVNYLKVTFSKYPLVTLY